jgi:heat shock protein HtpX
MAYSFVQIEQSKSRAIQWSLFFLMALYVSGAVLIVGIVKYFLFARTYPLEYGVRPSFIGGLDLSTLLWSVGGAFVLGMIHWVVATDALIDRTLQYMSGRPADPREDQEHVFCNVVEEVSAATGGKYRIEPYIIPTSASNAFALQDFQGRSVIGVTAGLLARLNRAQLEAVVAHEAGHIASGDCLETTVTSVVFKAFDTLCDISRRMLLYGSFARDGRESSRKNSGGGQLMLLFLLIFLIAMLLKVVGYLGSLFVSRQREYRADAVAARLTRDPLSLAEALHIIDRRWKGGGVPGETMDAIFILSPRKKDVDDNEDVIADLFSTHPPIKKRIEILLEMAHARPQDLERAVDRAKERAAASVEEKKDVHPTTQMPGMGIPIPIPIPSAMPVFNMAAPTAKDQCPRCAQALMPTQYEGVPVLTCAGCQGYLIGEPEVMLIVKAKGVRFDSRITGLARIMREQARVLKSNPFDRIYDRQGILCPSCLGAAPRMTRRFVSPKYPVEVDKCRACDMVWFDRDELEVLQCLYEGDNPSLAER